MCLIGGFGIAPGAAYTIKAVQKGRFDGWPFFGAMLGFGVAYYAAIAYLYMRGNQRNLQATLEASLDCGINHIETARMYGTSEGQIGPALQAIFNKGKYSRDEIILQTKVRYSTTTLYSGSFLASTLTHHFFSYA
eukprot:SAG31_NODE_965_length_10696_cov_10.487213_10_plen_135_part_00